MPFFVSSMLVVRNCCDIFRVYLMFAAMNVSVAYPDMQGASGAELKACCTEAGMFALEMILQPGLC